MIFYCPYPWQKLQNVVLRFLIRPLTPKIYSPPYKICTKSPISRLVWQIECRCLSLLRGFWGWPIRWNHAKCCGADPCCYGNEIWPRHRDLVAYRLVLELCLLLKLGRLVLLTFDRMNSSFHYFENCRADVPVCKITGCSHWWNHVQFMEHSVIQSVMFSVSRLKTTAFDDNKAAAKRHKTESSLHTLDRYFKKPT